MSGRGSRRGPLVVVGDVMLDVDLSGSSTRLSPDAPVPVVAGAQRMQRPGGAALAALLASRWHDDVVLITPDTGDADAHAVRDEVADSVRWISWPAEGSTSVKTRIVANGQQVARLDDGGELRRVAEPPGSALAAIHAASAVLVADYGIGAGADERMRAALSATPAPVVWDPHPRGRAPTTGAALVTPNLAEALGFTGGTASGSAQRLAQAQEAAISLSRLWNARAVAVTLGAQGALLWLGAGTAQLVPAPLGVDGGDTCGAGDCFAAASTAAMASGALPSEAVAAGVEAATAFVSAGAAGAMARPPRAQVPGAAAVVPGAEGPAGGAPASAIELASRVRATGGRVVATGGCFDVLHAGHVQLLDAARTLGDCLIVLLNSDDSVRRLKGPGRPVQSAVDRASVLTSLRAVDAVLLFAEDEPSAALRQIQPHVWVKGGDYAGAQLPEAAELASWGGQALALPYLPGRSTTQLLSRARQRPVDGRARSGEGDHR